MACANKLRRGTGATTVVVAAGEQNL